MTKVYFLIFNPYIVLGKYFTICSIQTYSGSVCAKGPLTASDSSEYVRNVWTLIPQPDLTYYIFNVVQTYSTVQSTVGKHRCRP